MNLLLATELVVPFIISNAVATWILWQTIRKPNVAEAVLSILFIGAGCFNIYTAFTNPGAYLSFAETSFLPFYREFIRGFFAHNAVMIISMIAVGQIFIGFSMLMEDLRFRIGCIGGFIFSLAIAPLGIGSAFPSTLVLAFAFVILFLKAETTNDTSSSRG